MSSFLDFFSSFLDGLTFLAVFLVELRLVVGLEPLALVVGLEPLAVRLREAHSEEDTDEKLESQSSHELLKQLLLSQSGQEQEQEPLDSSAAVKYNTTVSISQSRTF